MKEGCTFADKIITGFICLMCKFISGHLFGGRKSCTAVRWCFFKILMALSPLVRPMCAIMGIISMIQGVILLILAILAVLVHSCAITVSSDEPETKFFPLLIGMYFQGDQCPVYNTTDIYDSLPNLITPSWLFIWMVLYICLYILWIIFSIAIMSSYVYENKLLHYILSIWAFLTLGNCIMDLVLAVFFGLDYGNLQTLEDNTVVPVLLPVVVWAILIMALKGIVLWLTNLASGVYALYLIWHFTSHKDDTQPLFLEKAGYLDLNPIDAFSTSFS